MSAAVKPVSYKLREITSPADLTDYGEKHSLKEPAACHGLCVGRAHPLWNVLCCPFVMIFNSFNIFCLQCLRALGTRCCKACCKKK